MNPMARMRSVSALALSLASLACASPALGQLDWPAKPIRIVLANSPGAATDLAGRVFADNLSRITNRAVAVENRPGADGYIAAEAVAKAAPDGYTLFFASQSVFALDPNIKKSMPVDPVRDFTPLAVTIDDTGATGIFVHPSLPFKTLPEMFSYAKANPGKLSFATTVPLFGMMGAWIGKRAGIQMVEVPYKTSAQANADALSGQVQIILTAFGPFEQYVKAGRIRTLAVTKAVEGYPEIPPLVKFFPDFEQPSFVILAGPAGMSAELAQRVNRLTASIVENPKFNQDLATVRWRNLEGARSLQGTVDFIRDKRARWAAFIKEIGIEPH
ncbi:MAG: tripartite tricarboxylate transporter substrate binding protein [Betaproteobacteria bacterium]|nr:tripartite tricarboxylate transporter substrate binding protein [Betaproteobacteria bacterium]